MGRTQVRVGQGDIAWSLPCLGQQSVRIIQPSHTPAFGKVKPGITTLRVDCGQKSEIQETDGVLEPKEQRWLHIFVDRPIFTRQCCLSTLLGN